MESKLKAENELKAENKIKVEELENKKLQLSPILLFLGSILSILSK
jgi:hypothetical protein